MGADRIDSHGHVYNSIISINSSAQIIGIYDKKRLVPFGEYVPGRHLLPFMQKIAHGIGDFTPGVMAPHPVCHPAFLPMICYEVAFISEAKNLHHFDFIINITNDAWFGDSTGPHQHLMIARFRAAQMKMPLLRAANTGISAHVNATGTVIEQLPLNQQGFLDITL
jgi:apolipoprotein N-acyltransferase